MVAALVRTLARRCVGRAVGQSSPSRVSANIHRHARRGDMGLPGAGAGCVMREMGARPCAAAQRGSTLAVGERHERQTFSLLQARRTSEPSSRLGRALPIFPGRFLAFSRSGPWRTPRRCRTPTSGGPTQGTPRPSPPRRTRRRTPPLAAAAPPSAVRTPRPQGLRRSRAAPPIDCTDVEPCDTVRSTRGSALTESGARDTGHQRDISATSMAASTPTAAGRSIRCAQRHGDCGRGREPSQPSRHWSR